MIRCKGAGSGPRAAQQGAAGLGVAGFAGREGEGYGRSSIRGNPMNLSADPIPAGFSDGLGSVFFKAPVPSGCTALTMVESSLTASILMRTICSRCNFFQRPDPGTPFLDQRFMRV